MFKVIVVLEEFLIVLNWNALYRLQLLLSSMPQLMSLLYEKMVGLVPPLEVKADPPLMNRDRSTTRLSRELELPQ